MTVICNAIVAPVISKLLSNAEIDIFHHLVSSVHVTPLFVQKQISIVNDVL